MDDANSIDGQIAPALRAVQIIHGSLMAGVLMFVGFVLFQNGQEPPARPDQHGQAAAEKPDRPLVISYAAVAMFAGAVLLWAVVPSRIADNQVSKIAAGTWTANTSRGGQPASSTDVGKLLGVYQTKCVIAGALLEAPAFLAGAALMTERQLFVLGVIAGFFVLMAISFPTRGRMTDWMQSRLERIEQTREFGGSFS